MKGRGAAIQRHAMAGLAVSGEALFEGCDLGPEHEIRAFDHTRNGVVDLGLDLSILRFQVEIRDHPIYSFNSIGRPRCFSESEAASNSSTTRMPATPPVCGAAPLVMQSRKCSTSTASPSRLASCGADISPAR